MPPICICQDDTKSLRYRMLIGLGLKLLGIGKFLKEFFLQNWKWLVPLILIVSGFLWTKEHYYTLGQDTERVVWENKVKEETEKNKKLSDLLAVSLSNFGQLVQRESDTRVQKEITHEQRINTIIQEKPVYTQCVIDKEVLNEQNALKALGPKP
jgi:hypothetical protein